MDRASVYGTEGQSSQVANPQEVRDPDIDARSTCAALSPKNTPKVTDLAPNLADVITAWPNLPDHIKQTIESLIEAYSNAATDKGKESS